MRCEPNSSAGLGGSGPVVRMKVGLLRHLRDGLETQAVVAKHGRQAAGVGQVEYHVHARLPEVRIHQHDLPAGLSKDDRRGSTR